MTKELKTKEPKDAFADLTLPLETDDNAVVTMEEQAATAIGNAVADLLASLPAEWAEAEPAAQFATATACADPQQPNTLPVQLSHALSLDGMNPIKWRKVGRLPAFIDPRIRRLGQIMFDSFPCYQAYAETCRAEGRDPHAEVRTISDFTNGMTDVQFVAKVIAEHGRMLDKGFADFDELVPSYNPEIGLFLTQSWTFKLVRDRVENGAPVDARYIYAWPGGTDFYRSRQLDVQSRPALTHK